MTLTEYKNKNRYTFKQLADSFGTSIDNIFRWSRDGATVRKVDGKRCIFLTKKMAEEV